MFMATSTPPAAVTDTATNRAVSAGVRAAAAPASSSDHTTRAVRNARRVPHRSHSEPATAFEPAAAMRAAERNRPKAAWDMPSVRSTSATDTAHAPQKEPKTKNPTATGRSPRWRRVAGAGTGTVRDTTGMVADRQAPGAGTRKRRRDRTPTRLGH